MIGRLQVFQHIHNGFQFIRQLQAPVFKRYTTGQNVGEGRTLFNFGAKTERIPHLRFKLINALLFQLVWFVAVIYQNAAGALLVTAIAAHILLSPKPLADVRILAFVAVPGFVLDSLLTYLGVFVFEAEGAAIWAPFWLALLWCHFALYVQHGLFWLHERPRWVAALFGAIAAPLSYFGAARLGAVSFADPWLAMLAVSIAWLLLFPVFISLATKEA